MTYLIQLAEVTGVDLVAVTREKLELTRKKYPAGKMKGRHSNKFDRD